MTEQELAVLRKAMGVNSYGTFVDRSAANSTLVYLRVFSMPGVCLA